MFQTLAPAHPIVELEARQDEVLEQLDDLERRTETALAEFAAVKLAACTPRRGEQSAHAA
jgi:hypothetical protein